MRFFVTQKDAYRAISLAAEGAVRGAGVHALQCIHIRARDNRVTFQGTDGNLRVMASCEAAVAEQGEALVSADDLRAVVSGMFGCIKFSGDLVLESDNAKMELLTSKAAFPLAEKPEDETEIEDGVASYLRCAPFASTDERRMNICGVVFERDTVMATTGTMFLASPSKGGSGQIIPSGAQAVVRKIGGRLFLTARTWRVESENVTAVGSLVDHDPIRWRQVWFDKNASMKVGADDMLQAVKASTVGRASWVVLHFAKDAISLSGDRFKGNHLNGSVSIPADGDFPDFVADTKCLISCLIAFQGQDVELSHKGGIVRIDGAGGEYALMGALRDSRSQLEVA